VVAYRVYFINASDRFDGYQDLVAESDEDAIARLKALTHDHPAAGLWDGGRLVARLDRASGDLIIFPPRTKPASESA
jgi:hypothetical protein